MFFDLSELFIQSLLPRQYLNGLVAIILAAGPF
jgi:hypothetical protein